MNGLSAFHLLQTCCFEALVRWGQPNGKDPIPDCLGILAGTLLWINGESCCKVPSFAGPHTFGVILSGDRLYSNYCHKDPPLHITQVSICLLPIITRLDMGVCLNHCRLTDLMNVAASNTGMLVNSENAERFGGLMNVLVREFLEL